MEDNETVNYSDSSAASSLRRDEEIPDQWSDENLEESLPEDSEVQIEAEPELESSLLLSSSQHVDFENQFEEPVEEEQTNAEEAVCETEKESDKVSETGDESDLDSCPSVSPSTKRKKFAHADRVRTLHMRRNLDQLDSILREKEQQTQKLREELRACRKRIDTLTRQRDSVEQEIDAEKAKENIAAVFRLQATHRRLCAELGNEEGVEWKITLMLEEHEAELWQIEIEHTKFDNLREKLQRDEVVLERQRMEEADRRLAQKETLDELGQRKHRAILKKERQVLEEREVRHRKAVEDAQKNHEKAVQFLKDTMSRERQKNANQELKTREEMEKRMQAVLTLKHSITANRENIRVIEARKKVKAKAEKQQEEQAKEAVMAEGGDVTRFTIHQKRMAEFEKQKQEFEEQQQARKTEILNKILREEALLEKKKKQQHLPATLRKSGDRSSGPSQLRTRAIEFVEKMFGEESVVEIEPKRWRSPSLLPDGDTDDDEPAAEPPGDRVCYRTEEEEGEILAQPEFLGLWDQEHKPYKKDEADQKPLGGSKAEQQRLAETLEKLRSGIIRKQVASGHEFKGCPFYSKPEVIHFKDFDIGRSYKKKIILTNASYSISFCKLVDVDEHLKDFITIRFVPPGQLSPGMSCELSVTFKPMLQEDLVGNVMLLAQHGSFSVPIICTTKKCDLAVDKDLIDFGTHVVGETISRTITLTNHGALGTRFKFQMLTDAEGPPPLASAKSSKGAMESEIKEKVNGSASSLDPIALTPEIPLPSSPLEGNSQDNLQTLVDKCSIEVIEDLPMESEKLEESIEIRIGEVSEGDIGPFKSVKLHVIFTPIIPGKVTADFEISFDNPDCNPISITVCGTSVDLPVSVSNPNIDMKICMYDRLYQDKVIVQSRASSALRLKFEVCKEMNKHMELLPRTGYIQAHSSFSMQLKFLPRPSLPDDVSTYFDKGTGVLELPLTITVADQTKPVPFTLHAIVTTSDLEINPPILDFGYSTIYEAVQTTLYLTNKSILPQEFGFVGVPEYAEIQPNDGFGTLLPLETLMIDVIFKAQKAKEYSFELTCKSVINRQFKVLCRAVGVRPPLELSQSLIQFAATSLNDVSSATLFVINSHTSTNEFTHAVARIGDGSIAPVGPTCFEFHVPENSPITVSPAVGTVLPGKKCLIHVAFQPTLADQDIREEAVNILCKAAEARAALEKVAAEEAELASKEKKERTSAKKGSKKPHPSPKEKVPEPPVEPPAPFQPPKPEEIQKDSVEYNTAVTSLLRSFRGKFETIIVPCFVASCRDADNQKHPENLMYSPHNTLYLELQCPAVAPPLLVTSDNGKHNIDFGEVATGQRVLKKISVQNISSEHLDLTSSVLNPSGPFQLLEPTGSVDPGGSYVLLIVFSPDEHKIFFEHLDVYSSKGTLSLSITGHGLTPSMTCSVEGGILDMGYVLANDSTTTTFQLENTSHFQMKYFIKLNSLSEKRHSDQQRLPPFITPHRGTTDFVGTQNYSGRSVFSVSPVEGAMDPGKGQEVTVTFSPDHESLYYSDCLRVELVSKQIIHTIRLKGAARNHIMFLEGGDPIDVSVESFSILPTDEGEPEETVHPVVLSLQCIQTETELTPAVRELHVGCIWATQQTGKKAVEFLWDGAATLQQKGFTVDPVKGSVEVGTRRAITVSWMPPAGYDLQVQAVGAEAKAQKQTGGQKDVPSSVNKKVQKGGRADKAAETTQQPFSRGLQQPNRPLTVTADLNLKGDITETYRILITALVVSI